MYINAIRNYVSCTNAAVRLTFSLGKLVQPTTVRPSTLETKQRTPVPSAGKSLRFFRAVDLVASDALGA